MHFDRNIFFNEVRAELFNGAMTQQQIDGMNLIIALFESNYTGTPMDDIRWLSYMLASVYKECAKTMWPITEYGSQEYLESREYYPYIGRGFIMLTWEENFRNASAALGLIGDRDLVEHPDLALDTLISARIMFRGCAEGWFTGKRLNDYFNESTDDPYNARRIINGTDCAEEIAGYHELFLAALMAAEVPDTVIMVESDFVPEQDA